MPVTIQVPITETKTISAYAILSFSAVLNAAVPYFAETIAALDSDGNHVGEIFSRYYPIIQTDTNGAPLPGPVLTTDFSAPISADEVGLSLYELAKRRAYKIAQDHGDIPAYSVGG